MSEPFVSLPPSFIDARGGIVNIIDHPCGGVQLIKSHAGTERSNHFHRQDEHWLYCVSGRFEYSWRTVENDKPTGELRAVEVGPGDCIFTPPNVWHRCNFLEDTTLVCMSKLPRSIAQHDVVRA